MQFTFDYASKHKPLELCSCKEHSPVLCEVHSQPRPEHDPLPQVPQMVRPHEDPHRKGEHVHVRRRDRLDLLRDLHPSILSPLRVLAQIKCLFP